MKRRDFIKLSSASILPLLVSCGRESNRDYDVRISSDMPAGHLVFRKEDFKRIGTVRHDILIIGGGMAGLAAACNVRDRDFILCELSQEPGGTSASISIGGNRYAQGAHYDLAYPANFGTETLQFLSSLKITEYNPFTDLWEFRDKQYLIQPVNESRCLSGNTFRNDVIPDGPEKEIFRDILEPYRNEMKMPTRLIPGRYRELNSISFSEFLKSRMTAGPEFMQSVDYNMVDDYGGTADEVSALAGIHYYQCRPYFYRPVELFSPPQGNYYFIAKMLDTLPQERIKTGHLVKKIFDTGNGFDVDIVDLGKQGSIKLKVNKIIYAGAKHVLKYTAPRDYPLFSGNVYAPWLVMNFVVDDIREEHAFWQNEMPGFDPAFLGFVNSRAQFHGNNGPHILTVYYCFKPSQRQLLADIGKNKNRIIDRTVRYVSDYSKTDIARRISSVYIKVLGHAMPVPRMNYLLDDKNDRRYNKDLVYAGVDNSRLPLLFEALDSGIVAAGLIKD